jgi:2-dehydro-3-deoxygalactonokinase
MEKFISGDWGTSTLRLKIVDVNDMAILAETQSPQGIASVYESWQKCGKNESERMAFYQAILKEQILILQQKVGLPLQGMSIILSGMASSSIGMKELPYAGLPFSIDGTGLHISSIEASIEFSHGMLLISGVRSINDVMRGEETQLIGAIGNGVADGWYILPGTHSKHILLKDGRVQDFKTYMTGEFFKLLSTNSILANSVSPNQKLDTFLPYFERGVNDGAHQNLLHSAFFVRTNTLLNVLSADENYFYLSGLLISAELKDLSSIPNQIIVVCDAYQKILYNAALQKLAFENILFIDTHHATLVGQWKVYKTWIEK